MTDSSSRDVNENEKVLDNATINKKRTSPSQQLSSPETTNTTAMATDPEIVFAGCRDARLTDIINTALRTYLHDMDQLANYILNQVSLESLIFYMIFFTNFIFYFIKCLKNIFLQ